MIGKTDEAGYRVDFNELPDAHLEHAAEYSKDDKKRASARAERRRRDREHQLAMSNRTLRIARIAAIADWGSAIAAIVNAPWRSAISAIVSSSLNGGNKSEPRR
jgi:hypothetical protein